MKNIFQRLLREPVFHFVVIGAGIFAAFFALNDTPDAPPENQLVITRADVNRLADQFRGTWLRPPTETEMQGLIDALVQEEVLVREAVSLGLDQNDAVIRQRLRQKMDFLIESSAQSLAPDDDTLAAFLTENAPDYAVDPQLSFTQVYLGDRVTPELVAGALADLRSGTLASEVGRPTMLPQTLPLTPKWGVDRSFGAGFFASINPEVIGQWQGPVVSSFGAHIIRVDGYQSGRAADFTDVRDQLERDWRVQQAKRLKAKSYEIFRDRYDIQAPNVADMISQ